MRAQLTRLTCLSPGLAGLACPQCRSFGWPLRAPQDPCMQHQATRGRQPESPWRSTAVFTCSGFTRFEPPPRTASILLSFHHSTHSASLFPPPLPPPLLPAVHKQSETEKKKKQVNLNFQHCTHSECQSCSLISEKSGVRILASSPSW